MTRYTVLPWEPELNFKWAQVMDAERRMGRSMGHSDAWIAATALLYDLPLVTHNTRHFSGIDGLEVLSV
jgi:predicted nucleic acid-binding protein